jgi:hypothetical protein
MLSILEHSDAASCSFPFRYRVISAEMVSR